MMYRSLLVPLTLLLLVPPTFGQLGSGAGNLKVRVLYSDGRPCDVQVHVQLMDGASSSPVTETYTSNSCTAEFYGVKVGDYHVVVSGQDIEQTASPEFEVDPRRLTQSVDVMVRRPGGSGTEHSGSIVSAVTLKVPPEARKEFDKASELIARENWKKAIEQLNRAVAIYPDYAEAYNNLGVAYARLGDRTSERSALEKAIRLDDHFAEAYTNLAKMSIVERNFPDAEKLLNKANSAGAQDAPTLALLANVQLLNRHYDDAIATCQKVHLLRDPHALVHYVAGRALVHLNRLADAMAELQMFLAEEPFGLRADAVRQELAGLQARNPK